MRRASDSDETVGALESRQSTEEYSLGTEGYFAPEETAAPGRAAAQRSSDPFWKRLGFDSFGEYMTDLKREQGIAGPLPTVELPGAEVGDVGDPRRPERDLDRLRRRRQSDRES